MNCVLSLSVNSGTNVSSKVARRITAGEGTSVVAGLVVVVVTAAVVPPVAVDAPVLVDTSDVVPSRVADIGVVVEGPGIVDPAVNVLRQKKGNVRTLYFCGKLHVKHTA